MSGRGTPAELALCPASCVFSRGMFHIIIGVVKRVLGFARVYYSNTISKNACFYFGNSAVCVHSLTAYCIICLQNAARVTFTGYKLEDWC